MADVRRRLSPFNIINEPSPYIQSPPPEARSPQGYRGSPQTTGGGRGDCNTEDSDDDHTPSSPLQLSRDDVLAALGYKSDRLPQPGTEQASRPVPPRPITSGTSVPVKSDLCNRCGTKVYPVEKIDIGEVYHRGCFKCHTCGIQLTLKTFHRVEVLIEAVEEEPGDGERGGRIKRATEGKEGHVTRRYVKDVYCKTHVPKHGQAHFDQRAMEIRTAIDAQKKASAKVLKPYETSPYKYESGALEFEHARQIKQRSKVKRKSSLKTNKDYEKFGVYDVQAELEQRHRREEDELYRQIFEERRQQMERLEEVLVREKERTVRELIDWFEEKGATTKEKEEGLKKIDRYFATQREERIKRLLRRMAADEQAAVTRMIEKHAQEMLFMIEEKDREAGDLLASEYGSGRVKRRDEDGQQRNYRPDHSDRSTDDQNLDARKLREVQEMSESEENGEEEEVEEDDEQNQQKNQKTDRDWQEPDQSNRNLERNSKEERDQDFSDDQYIDDKTDDDIESDDNILEEESPMKKRLNDYDFGSKDDSLPPDEYGSAHPGDEHGEKYIKRKNKSVRQEFDSSQNELSEDDQLADPKQTKDEVSGEIDKQKDRLASKSKGKPGYQRWRDSDDEEMSGAGSVVAVVKETKPDVDYNRYEVVTSDDERRRARAANKGKATVETQTPQTTPDRKETKKKPKSRYQEADLSDDDDSNARSHRDDDDDDDDDDEAHSKEKSRRKNDGDRYARSHRGDEDDDDEAHSKEKSSRRRSKHDKSVEANLVAEYSRSKRSSKSGSDRPLKTESRSSQRSGDVEPKSRRRLKDESRSSSGESKEKKKSSNSGFTQTIDVSGAGKKKVAEIPGFQLIISTERIPVTEVTRLKGAQSQPIGDEDTSSEAESVAVSVRPDVTPPKYKKSNIYTSPDVFKEFDRQAIEEAKRDPSSFTDLVRTLSRNCKNDVQKVRAIFRWITAKDLNKIQFSEKQESNTPMGLLRGIKYGTETYHSLFKRLCSYAGLHCEVIEGYSKGVGYRPGSEIKSPGAKGRHQFRNQWTAVWVDDSWRFVNCNWGARHVKQPKDSRPTYKVDEFYFLTDAEEHIYQHFPDDPQWQLLPQPLSIDQFVRLPVVKSPFFNSHLSFADTRHARSIISTNDGRAELRLTSPAGKMGFAAKLRSKGGQYSDDSLANRTFIRTMPVGVTDSPRSHRGSHGLNTVVFLANLPGPGKFYWDIFVDSDWSSESMDNACSVMIRCKAVSSANSAQVTFPPVSCFGLTPNAASYGISEEPSRDPLISSVVGEHYMNFQVLRDDVRLSHTLRYWSTHSAKDSKINEPQGAFIDCDRYAMCISRLRSIATYSLRCPRHGLYVLSIGAATKSDGASHHPVVKYLIECRTPVQNPRTYPRTCSRWNQSRVLEPLEGELPCRSNVRFRIESPLAKEVVISVGEGDWSALQKSRGGPTATSTLSSPRSTRKEGSDDGIWTGTIYTGDIPNTKLSVFAVFSSKKKKYIPLLEYAVKETSLTDEVRNLFKYL